MRRRLGLGPPGGNIDQVIDDMNTRAATVPTDRCGRPETAVGYLTRHRDHLRDGHALEQGRPIAIGVVEGAAEHLVGDRLEITGAGWRPAGAEAVLELRAVIGNGDLDACRAFHIDRGQHRLGRARHQEACAVTA
jgi:hypothetical protein